MSQLHRSCTTRLPSTPAPGPVSGSWAFDDQSDCGGNGGTLILSLSQAPPPPTVAVSVNSTAGFDPHDGTATFSGTVTCTNASFLDFFGQVTQQVGRGQVNGTFL